MGDLGTLERLIALRRSAVMGAVGAGISCLGPVQSLFGTAAIGAGVWLRIILAASTVLFLVERERAVA